MTPRVFIRGTIVPLSVRLCCLSHGPKVAGEHLIEGDLGRLSPVFSTQAIEATATAPTPALVWGLLPLAAAVALALVSRHRWLALLGGSRPANSAFYPFRGDMTHVRDRPKMDSIARRAGITRQTAGEFEHLRLHQQGAEGQVREGCGS